MRGQSTDACAIECQPSPHLSLCAERPVLRVLACYRYRYRLQRFPSYSYRFKA